MNLLTTDSPVSQAWLLCSYFISLFAVGFVWRSWATYQKTGINPLVLPAADTAHGYIGRAFKWVMASLFVYLAANALQWLPAWALLWQPPPWLSTLAWCALWLAWAGMATAQRQMGHAWRIGIDTRHATPLVVHGLFRVSRNPIFLALRVSLLGLLVLHPTAPILALAATAEVLMQIQVRLEEVHLRQLHGRSYAGYCQRVRRWL